MGSGRPPSGSSSAAGSCGRRDRIRRCLTGRASPDGDRADLECDLSLAVRDTPARSGHPGESAGLPAAVDVRHVEVARAVLAETLDVGDCCPSGDHVGPSDAASVGAVRRRSSVPSAPIVQIERAPTSEHGSTWSKATGAIGETTRRCPLHRVRRRRPSARRSCPRASAGALPIRPLQP